MSRLDKIEKRLTKIEKQLKEKQPQKDDGWISIDVEKGVSSLTSETDGNYTYNANGQPIIKWSKSASNPVQVEIQKHKYKVIPISKRL